MSNDFNNNSSKIYVTNGNVTKYIYSAAGEKLRVIYQTAVPNITVAIGSARELMPSEILYTDSTDYLLGGALTLKNGRIDKYQFDEGYCQATQYNATQDNFTFLYYDKDHLGNVRQVTKASNSNGTVVQTMNYYPFGMQFCDGSANNNDVQPYKYNGKELDKMHGLNTYDYGARQYNPVIARWDRMDPLAEKDPAISPFVYCRDNPMNAIDPDGKDVKPSSIEAMRMIHNTLPNECLSYVQFDLNGYIDKDLINSYNYDDLNFNNLKTLVNDPLLVNVCVDNTFYWKQGLKDSDGRSNPDFMRVVDFNPLYDDLPDPLNNIEDVSSGQTGFTGKTLFPDLSGAQCSPDNSVYVIINKDLTESARADAFCHEPACLR